MPVEQQHDLGFRPLPFMGVIRVNVEAIEEHGYRMGDSSWSNLGQGQPEVGDLEGAPPRFSRLDIEPEDHAYGPVEGTDELRQAVADHYNRLFRAGHSSKFTPDNIAIAAGGRLALSRSAAALGALRLGYFTPDYTAYDDLLTSFPRVEPVHIERRPEDGFQIDPGALAARLEADRIDALLFSNPCNPTGTSVRGDDLSAWVELGRRRGCTMLFDEFYSHFIYEDGSASEARPGSGPISAARYIEDVNEDPVIIFDGLTKCFRYPGWRIGWVVAPKRVIRTLTASGSFLDGGPSRPIQRAATAVMEPARADQETNALREAFCAKRNLVTQRLEAMGVTFPARSDSTFYSYGSVAALPAPLNTGEGFMRAAFKHRVLVVPGSFFDVNPHGLRKGDSPLTSFVRFSFGPPMENVRAGLDRLQEMVSAHGG